MGMAINAGAGAASCTELVRSWPEPTESRPVRNSGALWRRFRIKRQRWIPAVGVNAGRMSIPVTPLGRLCCNYSPSEGNGALCSRRATSAALPEVDSGQEDEPQKFVSYVEGGGQVRASVREMDSEVVIRLEADIDSAAYNPSQPLILHWGLHRSNRSSWFILDPAEAPLGTEFVSDETEAMRTPFSHAPHNVAGEWQACADSTASVQSPQRREAGRGVTQQPHPPEPLTSRRQGVQQEPPAHSSGQTLNETAETWRPSGRRATEELPSERLPPGFQRPEGSTAMEPTTELLPSDALPPAFWSDWVPTWLPPGSGRAAAADSVGGGVAWSPGAGWAGGKVETRAPPRTLTLALSRELMPFSLDFVLYQPGRNGGPQRYFGGPASSNFSVPVGMERGCPEPLGATRNPDGSVNFAVYSRHAEGVILCLYEMGDAEPKLEIDMEPSSHRTGNVWHVALRDVGSLAKYGFRFKGDAGWDGGHRFHPRAVLLDPYSTLIAPPVPGQTELPSPAAALGLIPPLEPVQFDWAEDVPPGIPAKELVVYRVNVAAFTSNESSGVPGPERGTFLGVARRADHLLSLGINAVLLQPIAAFDEEQGSYYPFSFFAPMPAYGAGGDGLLAARDLKIMVRELHRRGIEVMIEVVVSHTAEGSDQDPRIISFRGIDNRTYYVMDEFGGQVVPDFAAPNLFNCNSPVTHTLIMDALRHWVVEYHIDGFSFVNMPALLTGPHGQPVARPLLMEALSFEPALAACKLIADPCSPSSGTCQVLQLPHWWRWMELNSRFRDDVRRFLRGDPGMLSALATRLLGSGDMFASGRGPSYSLNAVTGFVGLTLADLVSYSVESELSWGCGVDGPSEDRLIAATRFHQLRNFVFATFVALGVPVVVMGDECWSTKAGSTHQADRDAALEWGNVDTQLGSQVLNFIASMTEIRRRHHRLLERGSYLFPGDITWHGTRAEEQPAWDSTDSSSSFLAYTLRMQHSDSADGASALPGTSCLYIAFNARQQAVQIELPNPPPGCCWVRLVDTSAEHPEEITPDGMPLPGDTNQTYELSHFSALALEARPTLTAPLPTLPEV